MLTWIQHLPLLFGLVIAAATSTCGSVPTKPLNGLAEFKQNWESRWATDWGLVEANQQDIDHFRPGYVLEWERSEGDQRWTRTDSFTMQWKFYSAHEEFYDADRLLSRGPVIITQEGEPLFRIAVFLGDPTPDDPLRDYDFLYYELYLLDPQSTGCVFRSNSNFVGTQRGSLRGLSRVPEDTHQVTGGTCPSPEVLRANPYKSRLPAT